MFSISKIHFNVQGLRTLREGDGEIKQKILVSMIGMLFIVAIVFTGCMTTRPVENNACFPADGTKYIILGRVTVEINLEKAGGGYMSLLEAAKKVYPNADDVVNIVMDATGKRNEKTYKSIKLSGIAIDYIGVK